MRIEGRPYCTFSGRSFNLLKATGTNQVRIQRAGALLRLELSMEETDGGNHGQIIPGISWVMGLTTLYRVGRLVGRYTITPDR